MQDAELIDSLNAQAERLPDALMTFAECLGRLRERLEGEGQAFQLTTCQRGQAEKILAGLEQGLSGKDLSASLPLPDDLAELTAQVRALREQKKVIEKQLTAATAQLVIAIGVGATVTGTDWKLRIGEPRLSIKVKDASGLPAEFLALQPDRKAILAHVKNAAEVPAGVTISETKAALYFSKA